MNLDRMSEISRNNLESGFSLIELMISVSLLGVVFLGISSGFINVFRVNNSVINKTNYEAIYHSYFKKTKYGVESVLLENIDPDTSVHLQIKKDKSIKAYKVINSKWQEKYPEMMISFGLGTNARLKVNNWTFLKYMQSATREKTSEKLEIIISRCLPYNSVLAKVTKETLKDIYETKRYPVNVSGEVKCCTFANSGKYSAKASCKKLSEGYLPSAYSLNIKKGAVGYNLISFNRFINIADMDNVYALGFNGNFLLNYSDRSPASLQLDFFTYKNLCKTSSHISTSCKKIKNFTESTLLYNVKRKELYSNIKLKSISWSVNIYSTLLDSGNSVVY